MRRTAILTLAIAALAAFSCTKEPTKDEEKETPCLDIVRHAETEYVVIYGDSDQHAAADFIAAIKDATSATLKDHNTDREPCDKEMLVGDTGRSESDALLKEIGEHGYAMASAGTRFVIVWTDDAFASKALELFRKYILSRKEYCEKGRLQIPVDYKKVMKTKSPEEEDDLSTISGCIKAGRSFKLTPVKVGSVPREGNCYVAQGAASDGTYAYFVLRNGDDTEAVIMKYTLDPFKFVAKSVTFNGGHCNDLTYFDRDKKVILAHGQTQGKILTRINAETLGIEGDFDITVGSGAITYCNKRKNYAISQGGKSLHITSADFKLLMSYTRTDNNGYTAQGMGSDDDFVYFPMSGSSDNVLVTYDWTGNYVGTYTIPLKIESESMFCVNGKYYVCFYDGSNKGAVLYRIVPELT